MRKVSIKSATAQLENEKETRNEGINDLVSVQAEELIRHKENSQNASSQISAPRALKTLGQKTHPARFKVGEISR